jgi:hypothetical protein
VTGLRVGPGDGPSDTDNPEGSTSSTLSAGAFTLGARPSPYGRRVSGAMENRAAVFTSSSQDVEVYSAGAWWSGSLLGWRHEPDGACQVWVRAVVAGVERAAWTDLGDVRLPERATLRPVTGGAADVAGREALTSTISLFAVRDGAADEVAGQVPAAGGRRSGGRRRAPEVQEAPARRAAPGTTAAAGRHRAPAPADPVAAGRHRAADTGALPAVPADDDAARPAAASSRPGRVESARGVAGRPLPVLPEPAGPADDRDFYTRPLRLATSVPQPRSPRWDG